jgi:DNA-binding LacI/PurR family transcriptional regulator
MKKMRMIDVAEHAGVSKSTVSQYLNGRYAHMSEATKIRIEASIKSLNYIPNHYARSLKSDKTRTIGVIVRDIAGSYSGKVLRAIDDFCKNMDYNVLIYSSDFDSETEARSLKVLKDLRVDGIIIASSGQNKALLSEYIESGFPLVQFQLEYEHCKSGIVISDYEQASFEATEYLINLGHRQIAFLTQEYSGVKSREERLSGYTNALLKHGLSVDETLIKFWTREHGFQDSVQSLLSSANAPTALFSQHLAITTDLLSELNRLNVQVPSDVSVIGFDDLPMAEFFKVPVTVIKQDPHAIGTEAAKLLLNVIDKKVDHPQRVVVPCELVKRESCKNVF